MHEDRAVKNKMQEKITDKPGKQYHLAVLYLFKIRKIPEKTRGQDNIDGKKDYGNNKSQ